MKQAFKDLLELGKGKNPYRLTRNEIKGALLMLGWTVTDLSEHLGMDRAMVSRIISHRWEWHGDEARRVRRFIADEIGLPYKTVWGYHDRHYKARKTRWNWLRKNGKTNPNRETNRRSDASESAPDEAVSVADQSSR